MERIKQENTDEPFKISPEQRQNKLAKTYKQALLLHNLFCSCRQQKQ